jgi:transcriptional regulator GlxA family with amidase domain
MKKLALIVLLEDYTDYEAAYLGSLFHDKGETGEWETRYVSLTRQIVRSKGRLTVLPDLALSEVPERYNALILVGGASWQLREAEWLLPLVEKTKKGGLPLAATSEAADFLARHGLLNNVRHTGNSADMMASCEGSKYTNSEQFDRQARAVVDNNVVTADRGSPLQFAAAIAHLLEVMSDPEIDEWLDIQLYGEKAYNKRRM